MEFERNSNRRFAVKNKEIKQIIFSRKKNKKWIIIALVLVLTLGGGSVAAVTAAVLALKCRVVEGGDMTSASYYIIAGVEDNYATISNLEMAIGDFLTEENNESKEKVCVLGATVAKEIFGSGEYYLDGMAIHETKEDDLTMVRNQKIGFIFQNYQLIPTYNVMQNIIMPLLMRGMTHEEAESIHCQSTGGTAGDPSGG